MPGSCAMPGFLAQAFPGIPDFRESCFPDILAALILRLHGARRPSAIERRQDPFIKILANSLVRIFCGFPCESC